MEAESGLSQAASNRSSLRQRDGTLYAIAIGLLVLCVIAFGLKVIVDPERLARYTPIVSLHGVAMLAWFATFAAQARLARSGSIKTHKALGLGSFLLVVIMVPLGIHVSWQLTLETGSMFVFAGNVISFMQFVPLYAVSIWAASQGHFEVHRRLMLVASIALTGPAFGRVTDVADLPTPVTVLLFLLAIIALPLIYDFRVRGKPHVASIAAISYVILTVVVFGVVVANLPK